MNQSLSTIAFTVALAFCWSLPPRMVDLNPVFHSSVVTLPRKRPPEHWYVPPQPLYLEESCEPFQATSIRNQTGNSVRPAWISFVGIASWFALMILDGTESSTLATNAIVNLAAISTMGGVLLIGAIASSKYAYALQRPSPRPPNLPEPESTDGSPDDHQFA